MARSKYQLYIQDTGGEAWTNLKDELVTPQGTVRTKLLADGRLQYARRTGDVGIAGEQNTGGPPRAGQWRVHPEIAAAASRFEFKRAPQPEKDKPKEIPVGVEFE